MPEGLFVGESKQRVVCLEDHGVLLPGRPQIMTSSGLGRRAGLDSNNLGARQEEEAAVVEAVKGTN